MKRHPKNPGNYWDGHMAGMLKIMNRKEPFSWWQMKAPWRTGCNDWIVRTANPTDPSWSTLKHCERCWAMVDVLSDAGLLALQCVTADAFVSVTFD